MATKKSTTIATPRMSAEDKRWQARQDLNTIQTAAAIQKDPRRMAAAQKEAKSQIAALSSVAKKK